ncbi:MAG TPA: shikimate kinase [Phycisphaerae bacterium]|nr:shikimate kinase [Phycisphaerae bacterium]
MMNIVLTGYRCTGKTTVGRILSEKLGWPLVDTDALVQERAGKSIDGIVAAGGWEAFRDAESAVVRDVSAGSGQVISAGGGAILREENRRALKSGGKVILLRADAETIWARMQGDAHTGAQRPDLTDKGGLAEIQGLLAERRPLYEKAADLAISSDRYGPDEVACRILTWLKVHDLV